MLNLYRNNKEVHTMIGSVEVRCCAAQPQKPLAPCFVFKDSPQSFRILDVPKSIGTWELTRVYVGLNYPDNTNVEKDATRQGNVWVATVEGCPIAGKTMGGFTIYADGTDEGGNEVTGYVLGNGDCYVMEKSEKISALVGKTTMRILDDIPSTPAKGDVVIVNGVMKIYDGEEWYNVEVDLSDYYTKAEIDEKVDEIDSSISALGDEIPTKTSDLENDSGFLTSTSTTITDIQDDVDAVENSWSEVESTVSELNTAVGQIQNDVSALDSSMTALESSMTSLESSMSELETTVSGLDELAVKYDDDDKTDVHLGVDGRAFTLNIPDNGAGNGKVQFRGVNHISRNSMTLGVADTGETVGDTHVQLGDSHAPQAQLDIGANVNILSFNEEGKSQILIDGERLVVVTPEDVAEGKTLVATYVPDTPINSLSMRKGETMAKRDNPEGHWEYVSADLPSKTSDLTNDSGFITSADVADKRDYDDLTYANRSQEAMTRAPTYGIGKMIATPSDGTDPVVMDNFFIHENPSDPSDSLGSTWWAVSFVFAGTTDGTNFRMVDISFQTLATFTKTQLLAGEVTFTYQDKTWTLTAELGDGMIDWWNININSVDWKTTTYSYDPSTHIAMWRPSTINSWFITREYPATGI